MTKHKLVLKLRNAVGVGLNDAKYALEKYDYDYERAECFAHHRYIAVNFKLKILNPFTGKNYTYAEYQVVQKFGDILDE